MKTLMRALALMLALGCAPLGTALAQDKPAAVEAAKDAAPAAAPAATDEKKDAAPAAAADAKPAEAAAAPAAPPPPNKGDITFMYIATVLVILMTIPGLALFYGGLVRTKNMLSILMQVMVVFSLVAVLWTIYGYSMTFGGAGTFYGNFDK
ncbi:MAG TPA: ammonia channel protein, partial [Quisquiliibacterium sp.]|nr:ammonia channel protein [Quisquiliibacterium sp.]